MYFVTGETGFLGGQLCRALVGRGDEVVALARTIPERQHSEACKYVSGDILDKAGLVRSLSGCRFCFHLAGLARPWAKDPDDFYRVNVEGTRNVLDAAVLNGVEKLVYVSTAGVFGPSQNSADVLDEDSIGDINTKTHYERSKLQAENLFKAAVEAGEINGVIVNPTRVFGPGNISGSNAITQILQRILRQQFQILPSSNAVGNYVFIDDVVNGMIAALMHGKPGRNYILGGANIGWNELLKKMHEVSESSEKVLQIPTMLVKMIAGFDEARAALIGRPPRITRAFIRKYSADYFISSERAKSELGYKPTSLEAGLLSTQRWLNELAD